MNAADAPRRIVIVGASLAGLRGAEALRREGFMGSLTIVGDEPHRPYDRPPLSKHVLTGELRAGATGLPNLVPLRAEWRLGHAAVALDRASRTLRLADGAIIPYDRLLIATGAQARPWLDGESSGPSGVFTLRGREDAAALRAALADGLPRVLIVGAGLIGCEAASCCRDIGLPVTLVDPNPTPLARIFGTLVGGAITERLGRAGVDFRPSAQVSALEGDKRGRVRRAILADGSMIDADVVIAALGAVRNTSWLKGGGLMADAGGVTCDSACRALSTDGVPASGIYAAGDVARWPNLIFDGRLMSVEHWGNAVQQAAHAARNMLAGLGDQRSYTHLPAFWSSQFGVNIKAVGLTEGADAVAVVQGARASHRFLAVYGLAGRTVAAVSFDQARWLPAYADRIRAHAPFPPIHDGSDQGRIELARPGFPERRGASVRPERMHSKGAGGVYA
ncbi:NAD(P)/FAD-dependent oxidoreductase [Methylobacterium sp. J-070]|uniref:NAD(P)/FAD-dependent oxidoreductase n=1 Tax=Methylobacterium sp. J-070 TaxID=2836650 RepID=UPI001FB871D1|nr:FAD-dependent oxidoreductase [Methylobacterium sp. J-070]MCJ2050275.1 FAD-dependent oxidoreductase [Methylobacterium sp. J-070]